MTYSIEFKKTILKELRSIPRNDQIRISKAIKSLIRNPRPDKCIKLADSPYDRIRVGDYRIIYDVQDDKVIIIILKIGHRKQIYKK